MEFNYIFDDENFDYTIDMFDISDFIETKLASMSKDELVELVEQISIDTDYVEDYFADDMKEDFREKARRSFEENKSYSSDPYSYCGVSQSDFL